MVDNQDTPPLPPQQPSVGIDPQAAFSKAFEGVNPQQAYQEAFSKPADQEYGTQGTVQPSVPDSPPAPDELVNVLNQDGSLVAIHHSQLPGALNSGFTLAQPEDVQNYKDQQQYGTTDQRIKSFIEGAQQGLAGPLAPMLEQAGGENPEDILGRQNANPWTHTAGEVVGLAGGMLTGTGEAALIEKLGALGTSGIAATTTAAKIGSAAAKAAIENMAVAGSDEASKLVLKDPSQSVGTAVANVGLSGLLGGAIGGAASSVSPLWKSVQGSKVAQAMKAISDKLGGVEGQVPTDVTEAVQKSGLNIPAEIQAGLSNDPATREMFSTLNQSDTTSSGRKLQESYNNFKKDAGDQMVSTLGRTPEQIASAPELSKYESGKSLANTLADEYNEKISPLTKEFDDLKSKYSQVPLQQSVPNVSTGTTDQIADQLAQLSQKEGWSLSPSSEIATNLNRIMKELPNLKTSGDLTKYMTSIGDSMQSDPFNGPLRRAGSLIKNIFKDAEADVIGSSIGEKEGAAAASRYADVRQAYSEQSQLKEALDSRLHAKGSTSGYAKSLRTMGQTDGESVLNRLYGKGDADLLNTLQQNFPQTAQALKNYHLDQLVSDAASKAKPGETINNAALMKGLNKMSPELRSFVAPPEALSKVNAINTVLQELNKTPHNFSNTARTMDKLFQHVPGSAVGMATMLAGHDPATALVVGYLAKVLAKDAPDAIRLSMLKFLGSGEPISAPGLKGMVDYFDHVVKGEALVSKSVKNVFKADREVIPESFKSNDSDRNKLKKMMDEFDKNPESLAQRTSGEAFHYIPEVSQALGKSSGDAIDYLKSIKPQSVQSSPLDSKLPIDKQKMVDYARALDTAVSPLSVLSKVKDGSITPKDVANLRSMFPDLYARIGQKMTAELIENINKGTVVPYKTRIGASLFMGTPLDSTMTPQAILAAQPSPTPQPGASGQSKGSSSGSKSSLTKAPQQFQTEDQAAEQRRNRNK